MVSALGVFDSLHRLTIPLCYTRVVQVEKRIKLGFSGGPASGKTTLINYFRENRPDVSVVDEAARDYFQHNPEVDRTSLETQKLILEHMIAREEAAQGFGESVLVTDRTALDQMVYPMHYAISGATELKAGAVAHLATYTRLYLCDINGVPYERDSVRTEGPEEREAIHEMFLHVLAQEGIEYKLLTGAREERIMRVNEDIELLRS